MPSVLNDQDRETVKRNVPKPSNKILAVAVVRLYVAYPNPSRWTYTGLQGAAVLANDLVGNTFWLKLVDISQANKGVIWDQEIYEGFSYNQDRTFFHTFELESCLAGFSFVDEKEAKTFRKKIEEREKNASKATRSTAFLGRGEIHIVTSEKHGRFSSLLHRHKSPQSANQVPQSIIPPRTQLPSTKSKTATLDEVDPSWRNLLGDLIAMGITEEQIEDNAEFIKSYILEQQKNDFSDTTQTLQPKSPAPLPPATTQRVIPYTDGNIRKAAPPPPPPPPPPAPRRTKAPAASSPPRSPPASTFKPPQPKFKAPPPFADAGKFANTDGPVLPLRTSQSSNAPLPPPRPPKTHLDDEELSLPRFAVPPPFQAPSVSGIVPNTPPRPPPSRNAVPPPPPRSRQPSSATAAHNVPPVHTVPPPLPPKTSNEVPSDRSSATSQPPSFPIQKAVLLPPNSDGQSAPTSLASPPPPPLPPSFAPGSANSAQQSSLQPTPPPPPPLPPTGNGGASVVPPPPPPPPPLAAAIATDPGGAPPAQVPLEGGDGRDNLLASIRAVGGSSGGGLKKVSETDKKDRSAAMVPGAVSTAGPSVSGTAPSGGGGGLADALQQALSARNKKVSASDDEDDNDDWD